MFIFGCDFGIAGRVVCILVKILSSFRFFSHTDLYQLRLTSNSKHTIAFKSNFIHSIFAQPPAQWVNNLEDMDIDIFNYNMLLMSFDGHGQTSLFVIVGVKYICDYTKIGSSKNRPCILHLTQTTVLLQITIIDKLQTNYIPG